MKSTLTFSAGAALLALSACGQSEPEVIDPNPPSLTNTAAAPVELPPAIKADKTMRCKDNSLVYVTFFEGDKQATVRTEQNGPATTLKAEKAGDPLTAEGGYELTGDPSRITLTTPGKPEQSCRV